MVQKHVFFYEELNIKWHENYFQLFKLSSIHYRHSWLTCNFHKISCRIVLLNRYILWHYAIPSPCTYEWPFHPHPCTPATVSYIMTSPHSQNTVSAVQSMLCKASSSSWTRQSAWSGDIVLKATMDSAFSSFKRTPLPSYLTRR